MRLAEILSDLTSLRVCDPTAAQSLVSVRASPSPTTTSKSTSSVAAVAAKTASLQDPRSNAKDGGGNEGNEDPDLQRAKDLVALHYGVKVKHESGRVDEALEDARWAVRAAVGEMEGFEGEGEDMKHEEEEDEEVAGWGGFES